MKKGKPPRRRTADPPASGPVKTTISLDGDLYARLRLTAARRRTSGNAVVVGLLREALGGIVISDRGKAPAPGDLEGAA